MKASESRFNDICTMFFVGLFLCIIIFLCVHAANMEPTKKQTAFTWIEVNGKYVKVD